MTPVGANDIESQNFCCMLISKETLSLLGLSRLVEVSLRLTAISSLPGDSLTENKASTEGSRAQR